MPSTPLCRDTTVVPTRVRIQTNFLPGFLYQGRKQDSQTKSRRFESCWYHSSQVGRGTITLAVSQRVEHSILPRSLYYQASRIASPSELPSQLAILLTCGLVTIQVIQTNLVPATLGGLGQFTQSGLRNPHYWRPRTLSFDGHAGVFNSHATSPPG